MTNDMMDLRSLVEKSADGDLLREMIGFAAEKLMELEVGAKRRRVRPNEPLFCLLIATHLQASIHLFQYRGGVESTSAAAKTRSRI